MKSTDNNVIEEMWTPIQSMFPDCVWQVLSQSGVNLCLIPHDVMIHTKHCLD